MASSLILRKLVQTEQIFHDGGAPTGSPAQKGFACAVLNNPFSGRFVEDILPFMNQSLPPVGKELAESLIAALGGDPSCIEGFGKGAIVGSEGELEHGAAWHVPGGYAMRELLGDAKAIVPSTKKIGVPGTRLDVPITHINASYVRSHFDAIEAGVPGAPGPGQIVVVLAMSTGPRIHHRVGGLRSDQITGEDGLR